MRPTIVVWLWGDKYSDRHVHMLQAQLQISYPKPHRFVCITDRKSIRGVETIPMPDRASGMVSESIRMWIFSKYARNRLGDWIFMLDLDMILTGDISDLVDDAAPFRIWKSDSFGSHGYALNPSVLLHRNKTMEYLWKRFAQDPAWELKNARKAGWTGTEQAVIGFHLSVDQPDVPVWTAEHGIISYRHLVTDPKEFDLDLPPGGAARIVSFHGRRDPADPKLRKRAPWIRQYWGGA